MEQDTKGWIWFIGIMIIVVLLVMLAMFYIIKGVEKGRELKEELCLEHGFNYIYRQDGVLVNDCYSINDGIIQYYNVRKLNGTDYLMRGIR